MSAYHSSFCDSCFRVFEADGPVRTSQADKVFFLNINLANWKKNTRVARSPEGTQEKMATNKMDLVMEKCTEVTFRVKEKIFKLMDVEPQNSVTVKDLGIFLSNIRTSKKS